MRTMRGRNKGFESVSFGFEVNDNVKRACYKCGSECVGEKVFSITNNLVHGKDLIFCKRCSRALRRKLVWRVFG